MKIFYQRAPGRVAKTDMIVELSLLEIAGILIGCQVRLQTPHEAVVLRNGQAYRAFSPLAHAKA